MSKTILITGATDGIGKLTATTLAAEGHTVLLHGRNETKLQTVAAEVGGQPQTYVADLSRLADVEALAQQVCDRNNTVDVLINNAGVFKTSRPRTKDGLDVRFVVNTLAPYVLARRLLPVIPKAGRIVNLSSAAQAPVDPDAMVGKVELDDMQAYAQSKLAITIWSAELAKELSEGPVVVSVNPGSLLATKMVKEGFGVPGNDLNIGAEILRRASLDPAFADASGRYWDNDARKFSPPHAAAANPSHVQEVMRSIDGALASLGSPR